MKIPANALVVIADGRKIMFLRNTGDATYPELEVETLKEQANPADRDQGTDTPGRAHSPTGYARSAMSETNFHDLEEARFAAEAAEMLRKQALAGSFQKLIVVAPPRTLGELRKKYHKEVSDRIIAEVDKDLTGHPVDEITRLLSD
nr:host attachment protein [Pseudomonas sp.]